jgi:hypothetical protein
MSQPFPIFHSFNQTKSLAGDCGIERFKENSLAEIELEELLDYKTGFLSEINESSRSCG